MIFDRFIKRHNLGKYNIHFHGLRHTFSNMLFEMNENPKAIQQLLGHRDVKTTLTVYNSVDKSYYKQATDKLNDLFNSEKMKEYQELQNRNDIPALKREIEGQDEDEDDPEIELLERLLAEKKARKKNKDFEM